MKVSIRARFTLWSAALMAAIIALFGASVLWMNSRWGRAQFDVELTSASTAITRALQEELDESHDLPRAAHEIAAALNLPGWAAAVLDDGGTPLVAQWHGFDGQSIAPFVSADGMSKMTTVIQAGHEWRVLAVRHPSPFGHSVILVAGPLDGLRQQQLQVWHALLVSMPVTVALVALASWRVASSALRPVSLMAAQAERLTVGSPDLRLAGTRAGDELDQLARSFNLLLARLSDSLGRQRRFMADASHELRTPVSVVHTAAEVTLDRPRRQESEYREALTIVMQQSARLGRMVEDMLVLARADAGGYRLTPAAVYLDDVVAECVRAAAVVARTAGVEVIADLQADVSTAADVALVERLVMNLLDNAVQHTPRHGTVSIALAADRREAVLTVADTGPGVPLADRERIFERFVRLDAARGSDSGAGLGLAIARWIAEAHGGTLAVVDRPSGGSAFVARLPIASLVSGNMNIQ
ncbi:MAG: ATP-binding protein [Acidobacteriota bacterium]